jgi:hypothetical protein
VITIRTVLGFDSVLLLKRVRIALPPDLTQCKIQMENRGLEWTDGGGSQMEPGIDTWEMGG